MKIRPVGAKSCNADKQKNNVRTDKHYEITSRSSQLCEEPKMYQIFLIKTYLITFLYSKTNQMHQFPKFTRHETLHVSGSSSAHHQKFIYVEFHAGVNLGNLCIWLLLL